MNSEYICSGYYDPDKSSSWSTWLEVPSYFGIQKFLKTSAHRYNLTIDIDTTQTGWFFKRDHISLRVTGRYEDVNRFIHWYDKLEAAYS